MRPINDQTCWVAVAKTLDGFVLGEPMSDKQAAVDAAISAALDNRPTLATCCILYKVYKEESDEIGNKGPSLTVRGFPVEADDMQIVWT